ncbi:MAG: hypothetical protein ABI847_14415, partial [Anaerolineales bacterium]
MRVLVFFVAFWALALCIFVAVISRPTIAADAQAFLATPVPSVTALVWPPTPTTTVVAPVILESSTLPPTATPVSPVASQTAVVAENVPEPTATWFYVVPAQPSPVPTPDLPAAAPFPGTCDGPGRMNIALIGIDGFN